MFDYIAKYVLLNVYFNAMEGEGGGGGGGIRVVVTVAKKNALGLTSLLQGNCSSYSIKHVTVIPQKYQVTLFWLRCHS